ncbi:helix-turn-helix transcriptional regulator [Cellulosimicrobium marinum]|uniref:helix-turn-helix transcriptional regulator n=1 Tax=Cellulosimicrobium marinum TaxID=1638992 RepID=UPI001E38A0F4|nr:LuxR family transcriptional regulator [Cellulosimicrobium marinum]MCB7135347.1 AAA family ATPase [Cellulosimicrobium marinum]
MDEPVGRRDELGRLAALVDAARAGVGGAVVVRGEPGIGKTTLLAAATRDLPGTRVVRADGFEAESAVAYAALHRLVAPWHDALGALPAPHRAALRTVLGLEDGRAPQRLAVGLGLLELLAAVARDAPLVVVVDDLHWVDAESAEVVAFAARRLGAEPVALLLACRDEPRLDALTAGIETLVLGGLDAVSAARLLTARARDGVDPLVVARVVRATGGHPLALVDLAHDLTARELHDSGVGEDPVPVGRHLGEHYLDRVRGADPAVRTWLLVAAADTTGDLAVVARACDALGVDHAAAETAEDLGLVQLGTTARFRHPLVRAAAYGAAAGRDRRRVHAALARATEDSSPERAAWHLSRATVGVDPAVASRLESVADAAGSRGGFVSRARVLGRAAELTPPGADRDRRRVAAAEAAVAAGAAQIAASLLDDLRRDHQVGTGGDGAADTEDGLAPEVRARALAVRVALGLFTGDAAVVTRATAHMLAVADLFHGVDPAREQEALVRAFEHATVADRGLRGTTLPALGARLAAGAHARPGPTADVLRALAALVLRDRVDAVAALRDGRRSLDALDGPGVLAHATAGVAIATALWDLPGRDAWLRRVLAAAREAGSVQMLDTGHWMASLAELTGGTPRRAAQHLEQVRELRRSIGYDGEHVVNLAYLAWVDAPREQVLAGAAAAREAGFGGVETAAVGALAIHDLAEGRYRDAYATLAPLVDDPFLQVTPLQVPDLVEAAVRSGRPEEAAPHVDRLEAGARADGSPWSAGVALRCRALLLDGDAAADAFAQAARTLDGVGAVVDAARSRLLHGELLRRRRRRSSARDLLGAAEEAFTTAGASAFARRARAEITATGLDPAERRSPRTSPLTAREEAVARLAADGGTNAEIGATLFISANTVDYHLRKVFQKLGVSSRRQLRERLGGAVA